MPLMKHVAKKVAEATPTLTGERYLALGADFAWRDKDNMSSNVSGRVRAQGAREIAVEADRPLASWIKPDSSLARQAGTKQAHFQSLQLAQQAHAAMVECDLAIRRHLMAALDLAAVIDQA